MTGKELTALLKTKETADGSPSKFGVGSAVISVESVYIHSSGHHRAWKRLYYLTVGGRRMGGYDRRDSFVQWALAKLAEAA